jgi:hypothetical protein
MPVKQIAATFDLDPNAVSRLFDRAKNDLRRSYERSRLPDSVPFTRRSSTTCGESNP